MIVFKKSTLLAFSVLSVMLILQGCTVAYNKTDDELNSSLANISNGKCNIAYSLQVFGAKNGEIQPKYINSTEKVLHKAGCSATQASSREKANFLIDVEIAPFRTLPQEWLTGLSYGQIPSWGTRPDVYTYTFYDIENSSSHEYSIDNVSFNHIALFPVFWVTFLIADEYKDYESALKNFIENS